MFNILQCGDIHIGESRKYKGYLERHRSVLFQILDEAEKRKLALLITGDLFHRQDTTLAEFVLALEWLYEIDRRKIPSIIIAGNHDHIKGETTQLDLFNPFFQSNYVTLVSWTPKSVIIGDMGVICIPWRGYTTSEIEVIVSDLLPSIQHCQYKVVMLHECIVGSRADNGMIMPKGTKIPNMPEIDYWAIGDIHTMQVTNVPNGWYSGTPAQFRIDDAPTKGLIEVDLAQPSATPTFIPLVFKKIKVIKSVDEMTAEDAYYILNTSDLKEYVKANKDARVVESSWAKPLPVEETAIDYQKVGITDGLVAFLADKGIADEYQNKALEWVANLLKAA